MLTVTRVVLVAALFIPLVGTGSGGCSQDFGWGSDCSATSDGTTVFVGRDEGTAGVDSVPSEEQRYDTSPSPSPTRTCDPDLGCRGGYSVVMLPDVEASDLVAFTPARADVIVEPATVGVAGMQTNVVAAADVQEIAGSLLGHDVTVRFTPIAYHFDYGDGQTLSSSNGGRTWGADDATQFTSTPTSHVYGASGTYRASAVIEYEAHVDFGTGRWRPVTGTVRSEAAGTQVRIVSVRTALVKQTCSENPIAAGCPRL